MSDVVIDGSRGEGGGQIGRTSLALAMITGRNLSLDRIRARRKKPGLRRQHLTGVLAAAEICGAEIEGATLGSTRLRFCPGPVRPGNYEFSVGTAGSTGLVLQTILPPLLTADGPSTITISGGTHNPMSPPFPFLQRSFAPLLGAMGAQVRLELERYGFYPAGGGRVRAHITPAETLQPLELMKRGAETNHRARALLANLPEHIAERELKVVRTELGWSNDQTSAEPLPRVKGPGNALVIELAFEAVTEVITGFGEKGVRAETVARRAVAEARRYLASTAPVGEHLADQLMIPLALAGGGCYRTLPLSPHSRTNIETIQQFIEVRFEVDEVDGDVVVSVQ